jgi:hypothetical protein
VLADNSPAKNHFLKSPTAVWVEVYKLWQLISACGCSAIFDGSSFAKTSVLAAFVGNVPLFRHFDRSSHAGAPGPFVVLPDTTE